MKDAPAGEPIQSQLREMRSLIVRTACAAREGHIASAFSILDILWVLYHRVLRQDPANPLWEGRDRFVLSKGHGSLALYAILSSRGFFPGKSLATFGAYDSVLGGHPDSTKVPGVEASTGSLGHGLPMAAGMAYALKVKGSDRAVFCVIGDGEANEGTIWESALLAAHHKLDNLCCVLDYNHSTDRALMMGDLVAKFEAFGWAAEAVDGHDHESLYKALTKPKAGMPRMIIATTIKGRGCPPMESNPAWHHKAPAPEELDAVLAQLT
jgi:transketolase